MSITTTKKILVTGAGGLLGFHVRALLLAKNGERKFKGEVPAFEVRVASTPDFSDSNRLASLVKGTDIVLHLAGVNRASPEVVEHANQEISEKLIAALQLSSSNAHVVFANSTHAGTDNPYGRGKSAASNVLAKWAVDSDGLYTDVVLPHLFGEGGKPNYNTVTATLCNHVLNNTEPEINAGAAVELLHAGDAAEIMLNAAMTNETGIIRAAGIDVTVQELYERISAFKPLIEGDMFPNLTDKLTLQLYNTFRYERFPQGTPREFVVNADNRGELFEVARGGGGGQTFLSWTKPGIERGNHFHRRKVERFVVLSGKADIHLRKVFSDEVISYSVTGDDPVAIDMPTLYSHSIVNTGTEPLLTLFWAHEIFDSNDSDTYMDIVQHDPGQS